MAAIPLPLVIGVDPKNARELVVTIQEKQANDIPSDVITAIVARSALSPLIETMQGDAQFSGPPRATYDFSWGTGNWFQGPPSYQQPSKLHINLIF